MYRIIQPESVQRLPIRMLFQPAGDGVFYRACEADGFRGLVAAMLDDPDYEKADAETKLVHRLRIAGDLALLGLLDDHHLQIAGYDGADIINVSSDERFIRSLDRMTLVSLSPSTGAPML